MKIPCVPSPCSPRLSPWSAVTSTIVRAGFAACVERLQQTRELAIHERDLSVVGRLRESARPGRAGGS